MRISISLISTTPDLPGMPAKQIFESFPVIIGRDPACDVVLPDPSKYISSNHVELSLADDGRLIARDNSSNGTYINGSTDRVDPGRWVALGSGDVLTMGKFRLELTVLNAAGALSLQDTIDPNAATIAHRADSVAGLAPANAANTEQTTDTRPIGASGTGQHSAGDSVNDRRKRPNPLDNLPPQSRIAELDKKSQVASATSEEPSDSIEPATPLELPPEPSAAPVQRPPPPAAQTAPAAPEPPLGDATEMATLLAAAGLDPAEFADIETHSLAAHAGVVLNRSINSMMLLLRARDELKNSMRAEMTLLAAQDNNPLRYSVSAEDSLRKLLSPNPVSGFTDAATALEQALRDIKIHQMAMLEATRSALNIVLSQFAPDALEETMRENNPLAANMPLAREAKLWLEFKNRYKDIKHDAMEDFSDIFGRELRKAYEQSVSNLRRSID